MENLRIMSFDLDSFVLVKGIEEKSKRVIDYLRKTDIDFPCTEKDMAEALEKIAIPDLNAPKVFVSEVVEPSGLSMLESKKLNLDEVNYLAKLLGSLVQDERDKIYAVANYEGYDTPKELINVYFNTDSYTLVQDLKSNRLDDNII